MNDLSLIGEKLRTQDNLMTQNPMFCVQMKVRDCGFDVAYSKSRCWWNAGKLETVYDDDPDFKEPEGDGWEKLGYEDRWETVMVAFTEAGCNQYMELDGHNVKRRAFRGETRIYVESFNRCPEMIAIRNFLIAQPNPTSVELCKTKCS